MSNKSIIYFLILTTNIIFSQTLNDTLNITAKNILTKKISFENSEGFVADVLDKLAHDHKLKISYSGSSINHTKLKPNKFNNISVSNLLESLLSNTNFDYTVIGEFIVIVKKKKNPADTSRTKPINIKNNIAKHIYIDSTRKNLKISKLEIHKLHKIYRHEASKLGKIPKKTQPILLKNDLFIGFSESILKNYFRTTSNTSLNWESELNYKIKSQISSSNNFEIGYANSNLLFSIGISNTNYKNTIQILTPTFGRDLSLENFEQKYRIITIPVKMVYLKKYKTHFFGFGMALKTNYITIKEENKRIFEEYHEHANFNSRYYYNTFPSAPSAAISVEYGKKITNKILQNSSLTYESYIAPFAKNSLYTLYPHSFSIKIGIIYLFNKNVNDVVISKKTLTQ